MNRLLKKTTSVGAHGSEKGPRAERDASPKLIGLALASTALFVFTVIADGDRSAGSGGASRSASRDLHDEVSKDEFNIPNPYAAPWQYGMRTDAGYGGGWDEEVMMSVPQGDFQPLVAESVLFDPTRTSPETSKDLSRQMMMLSARYYDAPQMLEAYSTVLANQKRVSGGVPKPIQVIRSREDELPLELNWGKPGGQRSD